MRKQERKSWHKYRYTEQFLVALITSISLIYKFSFFSKTSGIVRDFTLITAINYRNESQNPMRQNYTLTHPLLSQLLLLSATTAYHLSKGNIKWLSPFDNSTKLAALCTQDNRQLIMHPSGLTFVCLSLAHS